MKKLLTLVIVIIITSFSFGQVPEKMSYQAIVRNSGNNVVSNQMVKMQISILKGSIDGNAVYVEEQTKSTNFNGLVTLEIGTGTLISGNFTTIDWSADKYFIKTETDPTGGSNYSITGTSQLLAVPYAFHSKTADHLTGAITETDPVFNSSVAANIKDTDITNWNGKISVETQKFSYDCNDNLYISSGNSIKIPGIAAANTFTSAQIQSKLNSGMTVCEIKAQNPCGLPDSAFYGLTYQGGLIFLIQGCSGYVVAPTEQSTSAAWWNGTPYFFNISINSYGSVAETSTIVAQLGSGTYAASICDQLVLNGYSDWFLPGFLALSNLSKNLGPSGTGTISFPTYWSSRDLNDSTAVYFNIGQNGGNANKGATYRVRAIRKF